MERRKQRPTGLPFLSHLQHRFRVPPRHRLKPEAAELARAADIEALETAEEHLRVALQGDRNIGIATGILVEHHRLTAAEAFETLRRSARARQCKLAEVAAEIARACESLSLPKPQK